jgi:hypothetical protein
MSGSETCKERGPLLVLDGLILFALGEDAGSAGENYC